MPSNHLLVAPRPCVAGQPPGTGAATNNNDCSVLRRTSPNGMLRASRPLESAAAVAGEAFEWTAAWGGSAESGCQLTVEDAGGTRAWSAPIRAAADGLGEGELLMAVGRFVAPATIRFAAPRGGSCVVAYILRKPLLETPPGVNGGAQSVVAYPPTAPPASASQLLSQSLGASTAEELWNALARAEELSAAGALRVELAAGVYDLSGPEWPFDFGQVAASVSIEAAAGGGAATLDGGGARTMFHLSLPTNRLTLRGLTLRNGSATAAPAHGAAVLLSAGELHAAECAFEDHVAAGDGGAIAVLGGASVALEACTLARNRARHGGAVAVGVGSGACEQPTGLAVAVHATALEANVATESGGAVWIACGELNVTASRVAGNEATRAVGGGIDARGAAAFFLLDSAFVANRAAQGHGAAVNYDPSVLSSNPPALDNCTFSDNAGLSSFRATQTVDFTCGRGQWTPSTGAFDELAATTATGHYEGCFFVCARGYYGESTTETKATCTGSCPRGHYCDEGTVTPEPCPLGTHAPTEGASSRMACIQCAPGSFGASTGNGNATCTPCPAGSFTEDLGQSNCSACPPGGFCPSPGAATRTTWVPCPSGRFSPDPGLSAESQCVACPDGTYNPSSGGTDEGACVPCARGSWCAGGLMHFCAAGTYADETGRSGCSRCERGHWCGDGATTPTPCEGGRYANATGLAQADECTPVDSGSWAPTGSVLPEACPASGFRCPGRAADTVNTPPGSKPIIIEVGAHTEEVRVNRTVGRVSCNITLEASLDNFDEATTVASLAALYNVSAADVSVRVLSGSILVAVEIAQPSPEAAELLRETVLALPDASLSAALNVSSSRVGGVATAAVVVLEATEVASDCPLGHWCSAGKKIECVRNTYNGRLNMDDASACVPCPPNSHTPHAAATSARACVCDVGFFATTTRNATETDTEAESDALQHGLHEPLTCHSCISGTACTEPATTLASLPLQAGFWRVSTSSLDVRRCPAAATAVQNGSSGLSSGCHGGAANPCKPSLARGAWEESPFCLVCNVTDGSRYYDDATSTCLECGGHELGATARAAAALLAAAAVLACLAAALRRVRRAVRLWRHVLRPLQRRLAVKLKLLLSFYQVVLPLPAPAARFAPSWHPPRARTPPRACRAFVLLLTPATCFTPPRACHVLVPC